MPKITGSSANQNTLESLECYTKKKKGKLFSEMEHENCTYVWEVLTQKLLQQK
jgi:hypothetical protein